MPVRKSTLFVYITWLLLGTLASTATAQTVKSESQVSSATVETTITGLPNVQERYHTRHTHVKTNLTSQEVEPSTALTLQPTPVSSPKPQSVERRQQLEIESDRMSATPPEVKENKEDPKAELNQTSRPLTEARFLSEPVNSPTAPPVTKPASPNITQTPETAPSRSLRVTPRIGAQFTTGPGVGYSSSFGTLEGFVPLAQNPGSNLTFLEGRLNLSTDNALTSSNLVLGHRFYSPKDNRTFGGYVAFDTRDTGKSNFNQIGLGLETLGDTWDFRANAYIPIGNTRQLTEENVFNSGVSLSDPFFQGNFLAQTRNQQQLISRRFEAAMTGVDVEAGVKIAKLGETGDLRGYGGLYYFDAPGGSGTLGWRTRLEARPNDSLRLGLSLSNDATFGTNLVLNVGASFPGTRPRGISKEERVLARLGESVTRNPNIVVDEQIKSESVSVQDTLFATNPTTGQPWRFQHANVGIGTGNGTFENPTGTVAEALSVAQPNDIVYVQPGTNPGIPAFRIPDGVSVLSTGPVQQINTVELGNVQLPLSGAGVLPAVTGTVTMGNNTTLSGFAITSASGPGISGTGISNVTIRDNAIANSASEGILLTNVTGQAATTNNSINNSSTEGFSLNNNQGQVDLTLTGNTIANNGNLGQAGDGVKVELRNTALGTFNISNNSIANNSGLGGIADGVNINLFDAAQGVFTISNNQIAKNQFRGIDIEQEGTTQGAFDLTSNTISDHLGDGVSFKLSDTAQGAVNISNSEIVRNGGYGIGILLSDNTNGTSNLTNNTISDNQDNGVNIEVSDAAQGTVNISNNQTIARNGFYGIFTNTNQNAVLRVLVDSNQIFSNPSSALSLLSFDSAKTFAGVRFNTLTDNGLSDLEAITISPSSTICLQPRNNTINSLVLFDAVGGPIQVEAGTLPTNQISTSNLSNWSGTTVSPGTCGF